ncbi:YkgJ family cysteine cluster protein [Apibacter sp.]|uniref:YkgJ family cysteine cluster protein n=1 Tax=Apibacter sp. TaxID=2023709 RepID=UPI0025E69E33|nr:YkgJ family cysteine cluster protein [Apibacter sp.]MCT6868678.1 YkgJ family cysteine cluster protein [Apibacter sp.]
MNLDKYKNEAIKKASEHKKYLEKLKQKKPKKLDEEMEEIHQNVFSKIDCLQCANCCKTTGPLVLDKDIERISKHLRMKPIEFIDQYLYKDEDNDWVFKQLPCPFLDHSNYCIIYEVRPKACKEYPHTNRKKFYQINNLTLKNTVICPAAFEVVELLMKSKRL